MAPKDNDSIFNNYQSVRSKTFVVSLMVEFIGEDP